MVKAKINDMKTQNISFRKTVMLRAYHIMSVNGLTWSESLRKAWQLYKLNKDLHNGNVTFYFEKKSGEIRKANGTLKIDYEFKTQSQPNPKIFTYFDVDANSFRSFKVENFIMVETHILPAKPKRQLIRRRKFIKAA